MLKKDLKATVNTIGVDSVDKAIKKVIAAGGRVVRPKIALPTMGWIAYCVDGDGNNFGLMEMDKDARVQPGGRTGSPAAGRPIPRKRRS